MVPELAGPDARPSSDRDTDVANTGDPRSVEPERGRPPDPANQVQVSVEAAVAALDSSVWELAVEEERPRAVAGTGVERGDPRTPSDVRRSYKPSSRDRGGATTSAPIGSGVGRRNTRITAVVPLPCEGRVEPDPSRRFRA